ncbi:MAG TPA: hypothetical protein VHG91_16885 [Longimicrobium sp.]|nr:hypothetical protein [Longimicrobium sp.]
MFDPTSRYAGLETAVHETTGDDGEPRPVRYVRRRFVPPPDGQATLVEHLVTQGERLDVITARYLADPTQFWRVCDANRALKPEELTEEIGRALRIALPLSPG